MTVRWTFETAIFPFVHFLHSPTHICVCDTLLTIAIALSCKLIEYGWLDTYIDYMHTYVNMKNMCLVFKFAFVG